MSLNLYAGVVSADPVEADGEAEFENVRAETVVTMLACIVAVLFASAMGLLMYMA